MSNHSICSGSLSKIQAYAYLDAREDLVNGPTMEVLGLSLALNHRARILHKGCTRTMIYYWYTLFEDPMSILHMALLFWKLNIDDSSYQT